MQFIEISVNALDTHIEQHGDFVADSEADCFDEGDDDGDDGDDDKAAALPDTGGPSQWNLIVGIMLTVLGMAVLVNRESMLHTGLFGPVVADAPSVPWTSTIPADLPETVAKRESHRGLWTAFGTALVAAAILGRRSSK